MTGRPLDYQPGDLSRRLAELDALERAERAARGHLFHPYEPPEPASWMDLGAGVIGGLIAATIIVMGVGLLLIG